MLLAIALVVKKTLLQAIRKNNQSYEALLQYFRVERRGKLRNAFFAMEFSI